MRRAALIVWYACQACLGLAMIGLAAVASAPLDRRAVERASDRIPIPQHSQGPSLP